MADKPIPFELHRDTDVEQPTLATFTEEQLADLIADATAWRTQPSLRNCIFPGCLRQYDAMEGLGGRPQRPEWSCRGWRQISRGPSYGSVCPDHADTVIEHLPRTIDLPNGKWSVHCACGWELVPQDWGGLLRPLWEQHLLTAAGVLPVPPALSEPVERMPLAEHTEASLTELYDALDDTDYDRAETLDAAQAMFKAWDWHRKTLGGVSSAIHDVRNHMRVDSRDWAADRHDAYLYGVLIGWGCQEQHDHDHDDDCGGDAALLEVASKHRWNEHRIAYVRKMRAYLAPITDPQLKEN